MAASAIVVQTHIVTLHGRLYSVFVRGGENSMTAGYGVVAKRAPIWPLLVAPLSAGAYYFALKFAFGHSMAAVVGVDLHDIAGLHWGRHWFYRLVAEAASVAFGTFIAAGIARERAKLAAIIGGLTISVYFLWRLSFVLFAYIYLDPDSYSLNEPYSQYIVDGLVMIAAPLIGAGVSAIGLIAQYAWGKLLESIFG
jgi:hypothetical protein